MAEMSQAELKYCEALKAISAGKLVIVTAGLRRDLVNGVRASGTVRDGDRVFYADTMSGPISFADATFRTFENVIESQHHLFETREAVAA